MYDAVKIAERINDILKEKQLSQKEMLKNCNLNKNAISTMLSRGAMPRADNLALIADYLDCSMDYLMGRNYSSQNFSPLFYDLIDKYNSLSRENQDEILHMLNYKYDQLQLKRKVSSSLSGTEMNNDGETYKPA